MDRLISEQAVLDMIFENVEYFVDNESVLNFTSKIKKLPNSDYVPKETIKEVIDRCKEEFIKTFNERIEKRLTELKINIPSAEPKTGHCKDCKWWKDSDGSYRRGARAESQCPINRKEVLEGYGYCYMYEPQESEEI